MGLRLFPNPKFLASKEAQEKWDPERYYNDPDYFNDPKLVRPYRVGMACAFCHASFHPLNPPRDVGNPEWANISGSIGAQYLRIRATFANLLEPENFTYHVLDSQPPGTIDTSLIVSDNINNPNTMNAIFGVPARVVRSFELPQERLTQFTQSQPSLWGNPGDGMPGQGGYSRGAMADWEKADTVSPLHAKAFKGYGFEAKLAASNSNPRYVPRVLLDGSDSVGAWVALARVYLNIGSYYEQWNTLHNPVVGFRKQRPFRIADCESSSVYWHATKLRVGPMRDYFLKITPPMPLLAAADHSGRLPAPPTQHPRTDPIDNQALRRRARDGKDADFQTLLAEERATRIDATKLAHGRRVFSRNCIVCHSSIQPESHLADVPPNLPPAEQAKAEEDARSHEHERAKLIVGEKGAGDYVKNHAALAAARRDKFGEWAARGEFWDHDPGQWLSDSAYQKWASEVINAPEFWANNFLSSDFRIPINLVRTNSARAMATNAITGNIWEDFSSDSYQKMPSVGAIEFTNPYPWKDSGKRRERLYGNRDAYPFTDRGGGQHAYFPQHQAPKDRPAGGGGPGFYRVPTLISVWATAPLLHNNSLGLFNNDPSVKGRLLAFDDAIRKLLWPERRLQSSSYNGATAERLRHDGGLIWRTQQDTWLTVPAKYAVAIADRLPLVMALQARLVSWFPFLDWPKVRAYPWLAPAALLALAFLLLWFTHRKLVRWLAYACVLFGLLFGFVLYLGTGRLGDVRIGPFPKGTPVSLVVNLNPDADPAKVKKTVAFVA
ncbi:MAG: hypothetical protein M3463_18190, partial [Verrucomicrobiota bacterium]|nr:hypothetical protein [Verrucomicrobiota bacterium]